MSDANAERGYTITRTFDAPRDLVWKVWTEPEQFAYWFGGTETRMEDVELDVRPGGKWSGTMVIPDGSQIHWHGHFLDVEEPQRLVLALSDVEGGEEYDLFTVTLAERGDKTELVLRQSGGHLTDAQYEQAKQGTGTFLDAMADLLARLQ
jgi:uncharacterized protein YndB with AHSA1/START domain